LKCHVDFDGDNLHTSVAKLLDEYSFEATKYILVKAKEFVRTSDKQLMVVIFDPYRVTRPLMQGMNRYDQEIVDFLNENDINYVDMNLVHVEDFKSFNLSIDDYFKRYFIGHYNPAGNHFFAYSVKNRIVDWLDPKPITYEKSSRRMTEFKGYLQDY
jgi:hypothetical protein